MRGRGRRDLTRRSQAAKRRMESKAEELPIDLADWIERKRKLHGKALRHFEVAASLLRFSREDAKLASAAFFHAVLGLECALRIHYAPTERNLKEMLHDALAAHLIRDDLFVGAPTFTKEFERSIRKRIKPWPNSRSVLLAKLIPALRNDYMHGVYLIAPDFVHISRQVRMIADQLDTRNAR